MSMHLPHNHRHKMKQEAAADVQLAANDMFSQWGNNFPIHQSSSAHASLPLSSISLPALLPPLGRNYPDGLRGLIESDHNLMFISPEMKLSRAP